MTLRLFELEGKCIAFGKMPQRLRGESGNMKTVTVSNHRRAIHHIDDRGLCITGMCDKVSRKTNERGVTVPSSLKTIGLTAADTATWRPAAGNAETPTPIQVWSASQLR